MSKLKNLYEQKGELLKKMRKLVETPTREWTDSVDSEFQDLMKQVNKISGEIALHESEVQKLEGRFNSDWAEYKRKKGFSGREKNC